MKIWLSNTGEGVRDDCFFLFFFTQSDDDFWENRPLMKLNKNETIKFPLQWNTSHLYKTNKPKGSETTLRHYCEHVHLSDLQSNVAQSMSMTSRTVQTTQYRCVVNDRQGTQSDPLDTTTLKSIRTEISQNHESHKFPERQLDKSAEGLCCFLFFPNNSHTR